MNTPPLAFRGHFARRCESTAQRLRALFSPRLVTCLATLAAAGALASSAQAQIAYDESVSGDLSNSGLTPTAVTVKAGSNLIFGTTGRGTATDRDYFTLTVPVGLSLTAVIEKAGTQAGGVSFFGIEVGPQLTVSTAATTADGLLGWTHYAPSATDLNIFPDLQVPLMGSTGFSGPIGAGTYSFWIQDFTAGSYNYSFDLQLSPASSPVPEPSTYAAAGGAFLLVLALRRRFSKSAQSVAVTPSV